MLYFRPWDLHFINESLHSYRLLFLPHSCPGKHCSTLFLWVFFLRLKLVDHVLKGLFLGFLLCSIDLCVFSCQYHTALITVASSYSLRSGRVQLCSSFSGLLPLFMHVFKKWVICQTLLFFNYCCFILKRQNFQYVRSYIFCNYLKFFHNF